MVMRIVLAYFLAWAVLLAPLALAALGLVKD